MLKWLAKHCDTCRLTLVHAFSDTPSEVVAKTVAITTTCVKAEEQVKTDGDTLAVVEAYAYINTLNKVVAETLAIRKLTRLHKSRPNALPTH